MGMKPPAAALFLATLISLPRAEGPSAPEVPAAGSRSGPLAASAEPAASRSWNRAPEIPLYQDFRFIEDYRFNHSIQGALRWGTISPLVGAALGMMLIRGEDTDGGLIGFAAGFPVGVPLGAALGYFDGRGLGQRQARDSRFHARRLRIGHELEAGSGLGSGYQKTGFALAYRLPSAEAWSPDEIQLAFGFATRNEDATGPKAKRVDEDRYGLRFLKSLRDGVFNPYLGATVGYADGIGYNQVPDHGDKTYAYRSPFVDVLVGLKVNLFDLAHLKAQASYEPYGPWYPMRRDGDYPYRNNVQWNLAFGTCIF